MSKAVLVMDMPDVCMDCEFCMEIHEGLEACCILVADNDDSSFCREIDDYCQGKPEWCPMKPLPEKKEVCGKYPQPDRIVPSYKIGWNACIDAICGEETDGR